MKKHTYYSHDNTGWPAPCSVVYSATGGFVTELAPPGANKHLVILGAASEYELNIRFDPNGATPAGAIAAHVPGDADGLSFPGALDMGEDMGVYLDSSSSGSVTIFYYIKDISIV
jgi:hypothetical protein